MNLKARTALRSGSHEWRAAVHDRDRIAEETARQIVAGRPA